MLKAITSKINEEKKCKLTTEEKAQLKTTLQQQI